MAVSEKQPDIFNSAGIFSKILIAHGYKRYIFSQKNAQKLCNTEMIWFENVKFCVLLTNIFVKIVYLIAFHLLILRSNMLTFRKNQFKRKPAMLKSNLIKILSQYKLSCV